MGQSGRYSGASAQRTGRYSGQETQNNADQGQNEVTNLELILKRFIAKYKSEQGDLVQLRDLFRDAYDAAVADGYGGSYQEWFNETVASGTMHGARIFIQPYAPANPRPGDVWYNTAFLEA